MSKDDVQQMILKKLEEYGDSVLESTEKRHKRKKKRKSEDFKQDQTDFSDKIIPPLLEDQSSPGKQRTKRKKLENETKNTDTGETQGKGCNKTSQTGKIKHLESIKSGLGLTEFKNKQLETERKKEESKEKTIEGPEVVVFTSHKKKQREVDSESDFSFSDRKRGYNQHIDLKQARFEVRKLGIKGFKGEQKEEAMTSLLLRLGAKPPKNKAYNYKEYQEMRKREKAAEKAKKELDRKLGFKVPQATNYRKRKRDKNDVGFLDGQVGKWKSGVQFVKKKDLKGMKNSKLKF